MRTDRTVELVDSLDYLPPPTPAESGVCLAEQLFLSTEQLPSN